MASLTKLLSDEGFNSQRSHKSRKVVKFKDRINQEDSVTLPIFICHDRRSFDSSWQKTEKALSLKDSSVYRTGGSGSERSKERSKSKEFMPRRDEPAIDNVAIRAMVSILSGYVGQYLTDQNFREKIKEKCRACFLNRKKQHSDEEIFARMERGVQSIEKLVKNQDIKKERDLEKMQNTIKLLNILVSVDSSISSFAHLYLAILYKIAKNDRISAKYLLQVFKDSPFLARTHLLPELWEHFFLPHLLHLKIWYAQELECLSNLDCVEKEKQIIALKEKYNGQMDRGTSQFALYYKEWLKVGGQPPSVPSVPLPSKQSDARSRRMSSDSSRSHQSLSSKSLYQEVFGPSLKGGSIDLDNGYGNLENPWDFQAKEKACTIEEDTMQFSHIQKKALAHRRSSSQSHIIQKNKLRRGSKKPDYLQLLACRAKQTEFLAQENDLGNSKKNKHDDSIHLSKSNHMTRAIDTICCSESLSDCEMAIRAVSEAWLDSYGDPILETLLSETPVIQGIMEVLLVSDDDEVLELAISILAELAKKSEMNRQHILNSDPQLEVSIRLLRSSNLFLKAAALLYLVKPKSKQMISMEWVPLVLRVLEFGDKSQVLLSVKCSPHEAAYYFLDQLLTGFDEERNLENARQIISLGGLRLLVRRINVGDSCEKSKAASVLHYCIRAEGSCRHYLAKNLKTETILSLLVLDKYTNAHRHGLALLTELLCLSRTKQRIEILEVLTKGWDCLNIMAILLSYLQRARPEEQPIIAGILLQLDLMGDPSKFSIYREEAIDTIVKALDCSVFHEKVQEQSARALLNLGGLFSYNGEPEIEKWLLRKAGFEENTANSFCGKDISIDGYLQLNEEDKSRDNWQKKTTKVLLTCGNRRLLGALLDSIVNSIPCLARASLVTVCWISLMLSSLEDKDLQLAACSILVPQLTECLNYNRATEERIIASYALLGLTKGTDYFSNLYRLEKEVPGCLHELSQVTWTAKELITLITSS